MRFRDIELDFDIFDAGDADAYEAAVKNVQAAAVTKPGEPLGDSIRRQCNAVFAFFDDLFGDGFHKDLFGGKTNLLECAGAFRDFTEDVTARKKELDTLLQRATDGNPPAAANTAIRRAAVRRNGQADAL